MRLCGTVFQPEAVVAGLEDVAMMGKAIEQSRGHLGVAEGRGSLAEAQVGGNDDAGAFVGFAQQVEKQRPA